MDSVEPTESPMRKYDMRESASLWGAMVVCFSVIVTGSSFAAHSMMLTSGLLLGTVAVWYVGRRLLLTSYYFISPSSLGFKDVFRKCEVMFDEIRVVTKLVGQDYQSLRLVCVSRIIDIPFDPFDNRWFSAVKSELSKRGIAVTTTVLGCKVKAE